MKKIEELPSGAGEVARAYPAVWDAYAALGKATAEAGPLDQKTRRLVKLALSIGASSEGAVHSHTRRAIEEGGPARDCHAWPAASRQGSDLDRRHHRSELVRPRWRGSG